MKFKTFNYKNLIMKDLQAYLDAMSTQSLIDLYNRIECESSTDAESYSVTEQILIIYNRETNLHVCMKKVTSRLMNKLCNTFLTAVVLTIMERERFLIICGRLALSNDKATINRNPDFKESHLKDHPMEGFYRSLNL
jgi:hypothetical protein